MLLKKAKVAYRCLFAVSLCAFRIVDVANITRLTSSRFPIRKMRKPLENSNWSDFLDVQAGQCNDLCGTVVQFRRNSYSTNFESILQKCELYAVCTTSKRERPADSFRATSLARQSCPKARGVCNVHWNCSEPPPFLTWTGQNLRVFSQVIPPLGLSRKRVRSRFCVQ